jgi:hypothetical protein
VRTAPGVPEPDLLFVRAMVLLELWLARRQVALLGPTTATPGRLTACAQMLRSAAAKAAALAEAGHPVGLYEAKCERLAKALHAAAADRAAARASAYQLPAPGEATPPATALPTCAMPPLPSPAGGDGCGLAAARAAAALNLGALPLPPSMCQGRQPHTFTALLLVVRQLGAGVELQHKLAAVERELFLMAASAGELERQAVALLGSGQDAEVRPTQLPSLQGAPHLCHLPTPHPPLRLRAPLRASLPLRQSSSQVAHCPTLPAASIHPARPSQPAFLLLLPPRPCTGRWRRWRRWWTSTALPFKVSWGPGPARWANGHHPCMHACTPYMHACMHTRVHACMRLARWAVCEGCTLACMHEASEVGRLRTPRMQPHRLHAVSTPVAHACTYLG